MCTPPTSKHRWIEIYEDMELNEDYWALIYGTPFFLTKNSKVLMTQYKVIHRILAVNHNLKKWKRIENDQCTYCQQVDTIDHFIYQCPSTAQL